MTRKAFSILLGGPAGSVDRLVLAISPEQTRWLANDGLDHFRARTRYTVLGNSGDPHMMRAAGRFVGPVARGQGLDRSLADIVSCYLRS